MTVNIGIMKKIVYIAHPIGGDVKANITKVGEIFRQISLDRQDVIPFAPYLAAVACLNDNVPQERAIGFEQNKAYFDRKMIDEVWLYGDRISNGMAQEIAWAKRMGIPVVSMSEGTKI